MKIKERIVNKVFASYFETKLSLVKNLLGEIKRGNYKSRIPVEKYDEFGLLMLEVNNMAEELGLSALKAQETNRSRKQLLQGISHDLRNPLASMRFSLETLRDEFTELTDLKKLELLKSALDDMNYATSLTDDLNYLAAFEDPFFKTQKEVFDLSALINKEVEQARIRYQSKGLQIILNDSLNSPNYRGDAALIQRLFRNLFDNSASFAKNKVCFAVTEEDNAIKISIEDDGPGFSDNSLFDFGDKKPSRKIIESSERASIGIGSVISKRIIQLHGGELIARNLDTDHGSIIEFTLARF